MRWIKYGDSIEHLSWVRKMWLRLSMWYGNMLYMQRNSWIVNRLRKGHAKRWWTNFEQQWKYFNR